LWRKMVLIGDTAVIADWISGYYGFDSLVAMLTGLWLMRSRLGDVKKISLKRQNYENYIHRPFNIINEAQRIQYSY